MRLGGALAIGVMAAATIAPAAHAARTPRILYASDWSGPTEIFAAGNGIVLRRRGRERVLASVTPSSFAWAPDGRRLAFGTQAAISLVPTAGGRARPVYRLHSTQPLPPRPLELSFSSNGRYLAFAFGTELRILTMRTRHARTLRVQGHDLGWSPDGHRLLYVQGGEDSNGIPVADTDGTYV